MRNFWHQKVPTIKRIRDKKPWVVRHHGYMAIYCKTLDEAKRVKSKLNWRVRTHAVPLYANYRD